MKLFFHMVLGYEKECFDLQTSKIKFISPINLSASQLKQQLRSMFEPLAKVFYFYKIDGGTYNYDLVNIESPWDIKALRYQGTLVLSNHLISTHNATLQRPSVSTVANLQRHPASNATLQPQSTFLPVMVMLLLNHSK